MPSDIDEILQRIRTISETLARTPDDDPRRTELADERDRLRSAARDLSDTTRHPRSVEAEISMLEDRLAEIDDQFVTKSYAEKRYTKGFSDPGAYSAEINRKLIEAHEPEIRAIKERLDHLRSIDSPQRDA